MTGRNVASFHISFQRYFFILKKNNLLNRRNGFCWWSGKWCDGRRHLYKIIETRTDKYGTPIWKTLPCKAAQHVGKSHMAFGIGYNSNIDDKLQWICNNLLLLKCSSKNGTLERILISIPGCYFSIHILSHLTFHYRDSKRHPPPAKVINTAKQSVPLKSQCVCNYAPAKCMVIIVIHSSVGKSVNWNIDSSH